VNDNKIGMIISFCICTTIAFIIGINVHDKDIEVAKTEQTQTTTTTLVVKTNVAQKTTSITTNQIPQVVLDRMKGVGLSMERSVSMKIK